MKTSVLVRFIPAITSKDQRDFDAHTRLCEEEDKRILELKNLQMGSRVIPVRDPETNNLLGGSIIFEDDEAAATFIHQVNKEMWTCRADLFSEIEEIDINLGDEDE